LRRDLRASVSRLHCFLQAVGVTKMLKNVLVARELPFGKKPRELGFVDFI
jgi:hypothetical protein